MLINVLNFPELKCSQSYQGFFELKACKIVELQKQVAFPYFAATKSMSSHSLQQFFIPIILNFPTQTSAQSYQGFFDGTQIQAKKATRGGTKKEVDQGLKPKLAFFLF